MARGHNGSRPTALSADVFEAFVASDHRALAGEIVAEHITLESDGRKRLLFVLKFPLRDGDGAVSGSVA